MAGQQSRSNNDIPSSKSILDETPSHASNGTDKSGTNGKATVVRRACNECRQQKLRCDVIKDPFTPCSRCRRLSFQCRIDAGFKRVEKRRIKEEQRQQSDLPSSRMTDPSPTMTDPLPPTGLLEKQGPLPNVELLSMQTPYPLPTEPNNPPDLAIDESSSQIPWSAVPGQRKSTTFPDITQPYGRNHPTTTLQHHSLQYRPIPMSRKLDGIELQSAAIDSLFEEFFTHYHPYLPFLDPQKLPDQYHQSSRLLFWAIISVASRRFSSDITLLPSLCVSVPKLLWTTLQSVPQNHHDVKALCILCTWPFPMSSSSLDPTFMLSGTMMHMAMQIGLHRPRNAQDFSKFRINLNQDDIDDRIKTWLACNIISQNIATGYGQPSTTMYDWILRPKPTERIYSHLPKELRHRLRVEKLCDRVTKLLYCDMSWTPGSSDDAEQYGMIKLLGQELDQLAMELIWMKHQNASEHFIPSLLLLYEACRNLLSMVISPLLLREASISGESILMHCPNYIFQMILVSGFTILKLIRSSFRDYIDMAAGKALCNSAILAVRKISITNNDLPGRLAEVLAQLWAKEFLVANEGLESLTDKDIAQEMRLKVTGRMSVSVMFDSLLEWRKGYTSFASREISPPASSGISLSRPPLLPSSLLRDSMSLPTMESPQEWNLDAFPYDNAYYPMTWMLDGTDEAMNVATNPNTSPNTMEA